MYLENKLTYLIYVIGILILTLGISFTIQADLGTSPFDALLVGLSRSVGLTVGSWEIIIAFLLICFNSLLKRSRPEFLGLITAFITGIGIDLWLYLLNKLLTPELMIIKVICFGIGLVIIGLGTATYLHTNFAPIPVDRLTLIIQELTKTNVFLARTLIYLLFLALAYFSGGPIGFGTILTVCFGGIILNFFMPITKKRIDAILYNASKSILDKNDQNIQS